MDKPIGAHMTSDGSLRFFALMTLLSLPSEMLPDVIFLDEPELGLHPSAIGLVGSMIESRSVDHQIIVATQSPLLVNCLPLDSIYVVEAREGNTTIKPVKSEEYKAWTEDGYSSGELWANECPRWSPMSRLAIVVEGETEEDFVRQVLADSLAVRDVYATALRPDSQGGNITVERLARAIVKLLPPAFDHVTTLVDFYGFQHRPSGRVREVEQAIAVEVQTRISYSWDETRFVPYVQMHEFEALLFSKVAAFREVNRTRRKRFAPARRNPFAIQDSGRHQ